MRNKLLNLCLSALMMLFGTSAWAIDKVDGIYQIGTVEDLEAFAALVNSGEESNANAVLTADIDCGTSQKFTIGTNGFIGKFDGQGHTVTINSFPTGDSEGCLFGKINVGGEVCNVITRGKITTGFKYASGIVSNSRGYIHNCATFIEVISNMAGDGTHGGIVAVTDHGAIVNCFSAMTINGEQTENCGGIIGWNGGRTYVRNNLTIAQMSLKAYNGCGSIMRNPGNTQNNNENKGHYQQNFFLNEYGNTDIGQKITTEQLASGEVCYRLNAGMAKPQWFQKEGDAYPMPVMTAADAAYTVGASVAANCMVTDLEEGATFTFGGGQASTQHEMLHGRCAHCGYLPLEDMTFVPSGKGIEIKDAEDVMQYSWYRYLCGDEVNAVMVADVDMGNAPWFSNPDNWAEGEFDGQGHTLTINLSTALPEGWEQTTEADKTVDPLGFKAQPFSGGNNSLFMNMSGYSKVHDMYVTGNITTTDHYAGTVTSHMRGDHNGGDPRIYNLYSDVVINSTYGGDCTHGGLIGVLEESNGISNVVFAGTINSNGLGSNCGGLVGWCSGAFQISNALMIGEMVNINGDAGGNNIIGRNPGNVQITGPVYYSLDRVQIEAGIPGAIKEIEDAEQLKDGSLTFALNNNSSENVAWTQTLEVDEYPIPMLGHGIVYAVPSDGFRCDGLPKGDIIYTNEFHEVVVPDHSYDNGFCVNCGSADFDYLQPNEDGIYEIGTAAQLANFSQMVDKVPSMVSASFILTDEIDMGEEVSIDGETFTYSDLFLPIGKTGSATYWRGTADGGLHPISNLNINFPDRRGVGFFGVIGSEDPAHPVVIENFIMDNTCSINGGGYVGLIGFSEELKTDGSNKIIMNNIGVECSTITCSGANAGGVIGCNMGSQAVYEINNCYVTAGLIKGGKESSALTGWFGSHATVKSCWTTSTVEGYDSEDKYFGRFGGTPTLIDCFCLHGTQVPNLKEEDLPCGKLAWDLNGHSFANPAWFQNLDESDPYPTVITSRGSVYKLGDSYYSATDEETSQAATNIIEYEKAAVGELIAQKATLQYFEDQLDALADWESMNELGTAYDALDRDSLKKSVDAYAAYKEALDDVNKKLENEYSTLEGEAVNVLKAYLATAETGVYEAGEMNVEEIKAESAKVYAMLDLAIRTCYAAGSDVTDLLANADFSKNLEGWTFENNQTPSVSRVVNIEGEVCYGIEFWAKEFNMSQTIEGLKPGVYEFQMNGAFRPSDCIYSYNHAAYLYANGIRNYIMTSGEDMLPKGEEENGLNAYINEFETDKVYSGTYDFIYFETPQGNITTDNEAFEGEGVLGSITRNPVGMAIAGKAGRYVNKVIGIVGEDGKLTVGACNPGTKQGSDGTLLANAKLKYLGTADEADLSEAYASMVARATSELKDYNMDLTDIIAAPGIPNYSEELKAALGATSSLAASIENAEELSKLFANIYDCKQAYKQAYVYSNMLAVVSTTDCENIPEGIEPLYADDELLEMSSKSNDIIDAYYAGSLTLDAAKNLTAELQAMGLPEQDEEGIYQAGNLKNLLFVAAKVAQDSNAKVVLTSDIDMSGVNFPGIGTRRVGHSFHGLFDGQGHKISNLWINDATGDQGVGFAGTSGNLTFKNVHFDNTCTIQGDRFVGIIGEINNSDYTLKIENVQSEATIIAANQNAGGILGCAASGNCTIDNCFTAGVVTAGREGGGITGWLGANANNWLHNSLSIAQITNGEAVVRHGDNTTTSNNFTIATSLTGASGTKGATVVTKEVLASGEVAYKLNGSTIENVHWFQTIATDTVPTLYSSSDIVYYAGGKFMNEEPYMGLNAFAYDVKVKSTAEQVEVSYTLNADAESVSIVFYSEGTEIFRTGAPVECLDKGEYTVTIQNSDIHAELGIPVTFEVEVTPQEILDPNHNGTFELPVWSPLGMAVNNVPTSAGFGQIYVSNAEDAEYEGYSGAGYLGEGHSGLYALTPDFELINEEGYTGGIEAKGKAGNYEYLPRTIRVTEEGRVFVGTTKSMESTLFEADAADLSAPWTPVFQGEFDETTGVVYAGEEKLAGPMISFDVTGKGADLKIAALMCNEAFKKVNVNPADTWTAIYNIGADKAITAAPAANIAGFDGMFTCTPATVNLLADQRGGFWFFQYRAAPNETFPAIKHVDKDGNIDFSNTTSALPGGAAAITADGNTLAYISKAGEISVYTVDYKHNDIGQITLKPVCKFAAKNASQLQSMAFDFAGNLYTGSSASERLDRYAIPGNYSKKVTPSVDNFKLGDNYTGIEDVKVVGPMSNGYIYNLSGQRQSKTQRGINIVNGQKILK